jgi:hypothetical protein
MESYSDDVLLQFAPKGSYRLETMLEFLEWCLPKLLDESTRPVAPAAGVASAPVAPAAVLASDLGGVGVEACGSCVESVRACGLRLVGCSCAGRPVLPAVPGVAVAGAAAAGAPVAPSAPLAGAPVATAADAEAAVRAAAGSAGPAPHGPASAPRAPREDAPNRPEPARFPPASSEPSASAPAAPASASAGERQCQQRTENIHARREIIVWSGPSVL